MDGNNARTDLDRMLRRIMRLTGSNARPDPATLAQAARLLTGYVERHRHELTFEHFPLPAGVDDALLSYELYSDAGTGLTLWLQAIRAGVDSVVHDHGTWAVVVAIIGRERNRIYHRSDDGARADRATLALLREVTVCPGQPLVLEAGRFHSIHTPPAEPALQLHLYGRNPDTVEERKIVDVTSGRLVYLSAENPHRNTR